MDILAQIDQDIKAAMLGGDKQKVEVLRGLKSSFGYAKTAPGNNNADLSQEGANLLSLQTRQELGTVSLQIAQQSDQAVLTLF